MKCELYVLVEEGATPEQSRYRMATADEIRDVQGLPTITKRTMNSWPGRAEKDAKSERRSGGCGYGIESRYLASSVCTPPGSCSSTKPSA